MAHSIDEVKDMTGIANALVINIGTLSAEWVASMIKAGKSFTTWKAYCFRPVGLRRNPSHRQL